MWMDYLDDPVVPDEEFMNHESTPSSSNSLGSADSNDNYLNFIVPDAPEYVDDSPLLLPEMADFLRKLINQVDIRTFVRLSRTSRGMHSACVSARVHNVDWVKLKGNHFDVKTTDEHEPEFKFWNSSNSQGKRVWFFDDDQILPPLDGVHFKCRVTRAVLSATLDQVDEFDYVKEVTVTEAVDCWREFLWFIKDYYVLRLYANTCSPVPAEVQHRLMDRNKLKLLEYMGPMASEHIVRCWIPTLTLLGARITAVDLSRIIEHIVRGFDIRSWTLGSRMTESDFLQCFAVFNKLSFNYKGPPPSAAPPIVFITPSSLRVVLLPHGRLVEFHHGCVYITIKCIDGRSASPNCPPCLQRSYYG